MVFEKEVFAAIRKCVFELLALESTKKAKKREL
jgi:hypothetical protein